MLELCWTLSLGLTLLLFLFFAAQFVLIVRELIRDITHKR